MQIETNLLTLTQHVVCIIDHFGKHVQPVQYDLETYCAYNLYMQIETSLLVLTQHVVCTRITLKNIV